MLPFADHFLYAKALEKQSYAGTLALLLVIIASCELFQLMLVIFCFQAVKQLCSFLL